MIQIVSERGYDAVTVRGLAQLAGVSTRTVYEHFDSKDACLLAVLDSAIQCAAARAVEGGEDQGRDELRLLLNSLATALERKPQLGRVVLVEALAAGPAALRKLRSAERAFENLIRDGFESEPEGPAMPPLVLEGIVAGLVGIARNRLLDGREQELPELVDTLVDEWMLSFQSEAAGALKQPDLRISLGKSTPGGAISPAEANEQVPGDERALVLSAIAKLAATEGYSELTIPRIRAVAGVSRRAFDRHFSSVRDCYVASLDLHANHAVSSATRAYVTARSWPEGVHRGVTALCEYIARDPVLTTLGFVEIFSMGPEGVHTRERLVTQVVELFHRSAPPEYRPEELVAEASVDAVWGVIHHYVVSGQAQLLPGIAPTLSYLALAPVIGAPVAINAIRLAAMAATETSTTTEQIGRGAT